jgi:Tryptophan-associated transmembrane protein (Trp_oprn_chp)
MARYYARTCLAEADTDATLAAMESAPSLDASRPSNLRLAAFALTAAGALLMGVGSVLTWVTVGLRDQLSVQTVSPGTDLSAGIITLLCAVVILVLLIVSRLIVGPAGRGIALVIIVAAAGSTALAAWFVATAADHYSPIDDEQLVNSLAQVLGKSADEIRTALASVIDQLGGYTTVGPGPWVVIVGGLLALAGGILTYRWATRVMRNPGPLPPH